MKTPESHQLVLYTSSILLSQGLKVKTKELQTPKTKHILFLKTFELNNVSVFTR